MPALDVTRDAIDYTQLFLTLIVLILTIGQLVYSSKNAGAAEKAANAAETAAHAATASAEAATTQAAFSVAQKRISDQQLAQMQTGLEVAKINADAATKASDTAYRALITANPPKLIVRDVRCTYADELATAIRDTESDGDGGFRQKIGIAFKALANQTDDRKNIAASFNVLNKGKSLATIKSFDCHFFIAEGLPQRNPCFDSGAPDPLSYLASGRNHRVNAAPIQIEHDPTIKLVLLKAQLFLIGLIVYADDLGNVRRTGFRRVFNASNAKWEGPKDPDWEYQD